MLEKKKTIVPQDVEEKIGAHSEAAINTVEASVEKQADVTTEMPDVTDIKEIPAADQAKHVFRDERDEAAENLIRWGAARAGVIVVLPLLGSVALMANEVYMISRLAKVYGVKLSERTIMAFLGAFGARVVGTIAVSMIPIPGLGLPVAISVTYGIGRVAQAWIKDGLPLDVKPYVERFEDLKKEGEEKVDEIAAHAQKNEPLGDETLDFTKGTCPFKKGVGKVAGAADKAITELLLMLGVSQETIEDKKALAQGVYEVAKETGAEIATDIREKVKEAGADARLRAELLRDRAQEQASEAKEKAAELHETAKEKAVQWKDKAVEKAEEAKVRAGELRAEVVEKATDKAEEVKARAEEIRAEAKAKAEEVKVQVENTVDELKEKVEEKAEAVQKRAEEIKRQ